MPNDTYTLTIADAGVTTPSAHASTHITGGSDAIQSATTSQNGLMTSTQVTSLEAAYTFANGTLNVTSGKLAADSVTTTKIAANNVTLTKLATVPADSILANSGNATGNVSTITCTAAGRALLDDTDAAAQRTTLGLGTLATQNANATAITGGTIAGADITLTGKTLTGGTITGADITLTGKTLTGGTLDGVTLTNATGGLLPATHASTHITGGSDAIQSATTSQNGLMTSTQVTSLNAASTFTTGVLNVTSGKLAADSVITSKILDNNVTLTKLATVPANSILANSGNATGNVSTITCTAAGRALLDDTDVAAQRTTLGLGTLAVQNANNVSITGGTIAGADISLAGKTLTGGTLDGVVLTNVASGFVNVGEATGVLSAVNGGTGKSSYFVGDIIFADTTTTIASLAAAPTGNALLSGGNATAPAYGKVGLATHVSGVLPAANGGTGKSTYAVGDIVYADTTTTIASLAATPTGNVLLSGGNATAPAYGKVGLTTHVSGVLPAANGGTGKSTYAVGDIVYADTTTTIASLAATPTGNVLLSGGNATAPAYGKVGLTTHVSGVLPVDNGGTGAATLTGYVKGNGTTAMTASATIPATDITGILPVANGGTGYGSDGIGTLSFDTTPDTGTALSEGQLRWNAVDKTLDLKMTGASVTQQIGEELLMRVHAAETVLNGQVVYISGSNSGLPSISLASSGTISAEKTLGMATETILIGADGYITLNGIVRGLDLAGYTAGQEVWLSTSGGFSGTAPIYPNYKVRVGYVVNATDGTGSLIMVPRYFENGLVNGTGKVGYITGAGGTVTQLTSKSTGVTLNKTCGQITMNGAALAGNTVVSFTLTNSFIELNDVLIINHTSIGTFGAYTFNARSASGSAIIDVRNATNGSLTEAIVINFAVIKAVIA